MAPLQYEIQWITPAAAAPIRLPTDRTIKIGRDKSNHLHLPNGAVSRCHATLEPTSGGWKLIDNNSKNGVYVNNALHDDVVLKSGDTIRIAEYSFRIAEASSANFREFSFDIENISITVGLGLDVGKSRQLPNQDHVGTFSDIDITTQQLENRGHLFVVSDGMGGHSAGEVASKIVVDSTLEGYYGDASSLVDDEQIKTALSDSIQKANKEVIASGEDDSSLKDMGATLVSAVVSEDKVVIANVGDSRAYRLRNNHLEQLTIDQTFAQELYTQGALTTQEFKNSPLNHTLVQAMGQKDAVNIEFTQKSLRPGDVILLCSDGLSNVVENDEIIAILANYQGEKAAHKLIERANANGGPDNISVVVIHVPAK